ncbi:hypothetical protein HRI_003282900 [Hibiscus trionum]|uniref:RRM domain-containing protein n=1 Tax=Hibiscus trionum TaxID=183268 RepID=A0A9W7IIX3_HIBTR|nr:hypothetical protein HRI_003282900 [Hibiscus trionum]
MERRWQEKARRWPEKVRSRRSSGYTMFINNISKRIHHLTLKEAFEIYGNVVDVYIAYWNPARKMKRSTFAFVRFKTEGEAMKAVEKANGRLMDGFTIRVFMSRRSKNSNALETSHPVQKAGSDSKAHRPPLVLIDSRSYKEALLGSKKVASTPKGRNDGGTECLKASSDDTNITVITMDKAVNDLKDSLVNKDMVIVDKEKDKWRKRCLVGVIKSMYNLEIVQDAFRSDGIEVKVCPWHSLLVVLQFSDLETMGRVWNRRGELLDMWFSELEKLKGFDGKRRIKVWAILEDVPLQVWNENFFMELGSRWGMVVKIDEETLQRDRFDEARLLISVQRVSCIPERLTITVNGRRQAVRIRTAEYDGDRTFIDGISPFDRSEMERNEASPANPGNIDAFKVHSVSKTMVGGVQDSEKIMESLNEDDVALCHVNVDKQIIPSETSGVGLYEVSVISDSGPVGQLKSGVGVNQVEVIGPSISNGSKLLEVPVLGPADVDGPFTGEVASTPHGLRMLSQKDTCLSKIRKDGWRYGVDRNDGRKSALSVKKKSKINAKGNKRKRRKAAKVLPLADSQALGLPCVDSSPNLAGKSQPISEAKETLEVCRKMGVEFDADESLVLRRFEELEGHLDCQKWRVNRCRGFLCEIVVYNKLLLSYMEC